MRLRGLLLMALSNKFGEMLLTTGNKSEVAVGYSQFMAIWPGDIIRSRTSTKHVCLKPADGATLTTAIG